MEKQKHVLKKSTLLKKTIPYIRKFKGWFVLTIILCIITALLSAFTPFITKEILDNYLPNENYQMVTYALILYGVVAVILLISRYFFAFVNTLTGMKIEKMIRDDAIRKINHLPVDYFSLEPDGKIVAKITSDSNGVKVFYTTIFQIINALMNITIVYISLLII